MGEDADSADEIVPENEGGATYKPRKRNKEQSTLANFRQEVKNLVFDIETEGDTQKFHQLQSLFWDALTGEFKNQVHEIVSIALRYSKHLSPDFVELITKTRDQVSVTMASRKKKKPVAQEVPQEEQD